MDFGVAPVTWLSGGRPAVGDLDGGQTRVLGFAAYVAEHAVHLRVLLGEVYSMEDLGFVLIIFGAFHGNALELFEGTGLATFLQTCSDVFPDLRDGKRGGVYSGGERFGNAMLSTGGSKTGSEIKIVLEGRFQFLESSSPYTESVYFKGPPFWSGLFAIPFAEVATFAKGGIKAFNEGIIAGVAIE